MPEARVVIAGSERSEPPGNLLGEEAPDALIVVSIYLKSVTAPDPGAIKTRRALRQQREAELLEPMGALRTFLQGEGLRLLTIDYGRRLARVEGSAAAFEQAFSVTLKRYQHEGGSFRARSGALFAPRSVANSVEAVLGLDQRPLATPKSIALGSTAAFKGYAPTAVAALYGFPEGGATSQCVGLIELGGGFRQSDVDAAFEAMGSPAPVVVTASVSGGANQPGKDAGADGEVALDIQVAGAAAPGVKLTVYFAPNTDQGFVDAISQAAHDETNAPSILSISWGSAESVWTPQAMTAMGSALQDAASLGVTVCAASGDGLATDGVGDGKAHVDFPASSPLVVGCGGTHLDVSSGAIAGETVWNSDGGGSGGGISTLFPVPDYQHGVDLPPAAAGARAGRGVPDVAADADPNTGYRVVVDGKTQVFGGTSAAAPLWAALFALINHRRKTPVGQPHPLLYAHPDVFRDIVSGDNKSDGVGYVAKPGWDACTGLGAPLAAKVAALFSDPGESAGKR